jgi:hypothetical protein
VAGLLLALLNASAALAQPANDDFNNATVISALPFTDTISTADATAAADDPSCTSNEHSVWYSFTPTQDVTIRADASSGDYNPSLGIYTGSRGALSEAACASFPAQVTFNASANTTYFFMVASAFGGPGGTLAFNVVGLAPPANDDFDSATVISALPFTDSISTVDASTAGDDPFCNGNEHTVWYAFTPTQDTPIRADTSGSDYATSLGVYTGSRGALSQVACASVPAEVSFTATANTTYFFMVASACCGNPGGNLVFRVNPPPANDDFDNATVVGGVPFDDSVFTGGATTAADDPSCNGNAHSVWYAFTPTRDLPVRADTSGSDYTTSLGVYTGSRGALSQVACASSPAQVAFNASANTTYFFMVASAAGSPGGTLVFNVNEGPPANDELTGATPLTLNTTITQNMALATRAPTDPTTCRDDFDNTVWFSFTATRSQPLNLDIRGTTTRGFLALLTDLGSGPVVIACASISEESRPGLRFNATAGRTYFIMAAAFRSDQAGLLPLTVRPAVVATVGIDPAGTVDRQGVADVTGTLACNPGVGGTSLHVVLRQRISKTLVITGSRDLSNLLCATTPDSWSATIIGDNGPFRKGRAEVFVTGSACDPVGCDTPDVRQLVDLRRT